MAIIEHVNISVKNPEKTAKMLGHLFGWKERWSGPAIAGGRTIHFGDDKTYIAIYTPSTEAGEVSRHEKGKPLNHIGILVDNLDEIESRVKDLGLAPFNHANYEPGRRFYFFDYDGIEWEIISYN